MKKDNKSNITQVNFLELLFLLFLGLKLAKLIDWSWWWVFSPIWIPLIGVFIIVGIAVVIAIVQERMKKDKK